MGFDQKLVDRIRDAISVTHEYVEEKTMFQGLCFMVNEKMCICVRDDEMMCRIGHENYEEVMEMNGVRAMIHGKRMMKGYVFVSPEGYADKEDFDRWISISLEFNKIAKASKKKKQSKGS